MSALAPLIAELYQNFHNYKVKFIKTQKTDLSSLKISPALTDVINGVSRTPKKKSDFIGIEELKK